MINSQFSATEAIQQESKIRSLDLGIVESEIREVQAKRYCGDIIFSFVHGVLKPICRLNMTKKII